MDGHSMHVPYQVFERGRWQWGEVVHWQGQEGRWRWAALGGEGRLCWKGRAGTYEGLLLPKSESQ